MKLSIAWIFDHIDADWKTIDIPKLVEQFNQTTAEIEGFQKITVDLDLFTCAQIVKIQKDMILVHSPQLQRDIELVYRDDVQKDQWYLVKKQNDQFVWAAGNDFHSAKEVMLPALYCEKQIQAGEWQQSFETEDYIIEVDNKSITHRPDMWGHRGFAREIAAILELPFKPLEEFIIHKVIKQFDDHAPSTITHPIEVEVKNPEICKRFAGLYFEHIERRPSLLWMAHRLLRVGSRPIDAIVDATNYVMLDMSQPMHAFDAAAIGTRNIMPRRAKNKEKLTLLDDQVIELTSDDYVITDGKKPIALAGVMGGRETGISPTTKSIFLESACFDATAIRRTSIRYKQRTEASARFEKSLDPNQNTLAILRFLKLLDDAHIPFNAADEIVSLGARAQELTINVEHSFLEKRLGVTIASDFVVRTLKKLEFAVEHAGGAYSITVPTFRCAKDVTIKEDIVEEVGRFFGFSTITHTLPHRQMRSFDLSSVHRLRSIKQLMAYTLTMREVYNYAFYDEEFLRELQWEPQNAIAVKNPVSENWQRLVTSLIPTLFKNIDHNVADHDQLRFFEWGRIWQQAKNIMEQKSLAGIFFDRKNTIDFYDAKALLAPLFDMLDMNVSYKRVDTPHDPWFAHYQTAHIMHKSNKIGIAGKVQPVLFNRVTEGDAFVFELDGDFLLNYKPELKRYKPVAKYPDVIRDISMLMPLHVMVQDIIAMIAQADKKIVDVALIDFFEKEEWKEQRALTFRFIVRDPTKTLTKEEVDVIWSAVAALLQQRGATIR